MPVVFLSATCVLVVTGIDFTGDVGLRGHPALVCWSKVFGSGWACHVPFVGLLPCLRLAPGAEYLTGDHEEPIRAGEDRRDSLRRSLVRQVGLLSG